MKKYLKAIIAVVGNTAAAIVTVTDPESETHLIVAGLLALLTVLGVYQVPNSSEATLKIKD